MKNDIPMSAFSRALMSGLNLASVGAICKKGKKYGVLLKARNPCKERSAIC